jgi:hypothetical protein
MVTCFTLQLPARQPPREQNTWTANKTLQSSQAAYSLNHEAAAAVNEHEQSTKPVYTPNLTLIGGIDAGEGQWKTTAVDNTINGKNVTRTKKLWNNVNAQVSPITGEVMQNSILQPQVPKSLIENDDDDPDAGLHPLVRRLKDRIVARGSSGIVGLQRKFRIMDDDGSKSLNMMEFKKAMKETVPEFSDGDASNLFRMFGTLLL